MQVQVAEETAAVPWSGVVPVAVAEPVMAASLLATHMPGIDVLRGAAVLAVVVYHGMAYQAPRVEWGSRFGDWLYELTAWGWLGVNLFFVISGFLITGILDDTLRRQNFYQRFYLRRALRILPAYLAVLVLAWAAGFVTPNYMVVCVVFPGEYARTFSAAWISVLWALLVAGGGGAVLSVVANAVSEDAAAGDSVDQPVFAGGVSRAAGAGVCAHLLHTGDALSKMWMIADNLAIGAVLAVLLRWPGVTLRQFAGLGLGMCCMGSRGVGMLFGTGRMGTQDVLRNSVGLSCFLLICGSTVVGMLCLYRERHLPEWVRFFVFFGEISYGLYLIHLLLLQIYDREFGSGFAEDWRLLLLRFLVANGTAVGVAVLSRRWFEDPILRMKSRIAAAR
jgi:peptidoglycan/LPS O-acetylase OafA/YrhL